jgi:hypothetical protein
MCTFRLTRVTSLTSRILTLVPKEKYPTFYEVPLSRFGFYPMWLLSLGTPFTPPKIDVDRDLSSWPESFHIRHQYGSLWNRSTIYLC